MVGLLDYVQRLVGIPEDMSSDPAARGVMGIPQPQRKPSGLLGTSAPQPPSRTEFVRNILSSRYSPQVVAGMMGNIDVETEGTFDPMKKQTKGPGRGLFQMEGKMLRAYNKYIDDNDLKNTAQSQLNFMSEILSNSNVYDIGGGHRKAMKKAFESGDVDTITSEFSKRVLRPGKPHLDRRLESARRFSR
tara:strand:- start:187 stop:753 length:567 start_codon:yes stop_codon:yes gene_type:complete